MVESLFLDAVRTLGDGIGGAPEAYAALETSYRGRPYHDLRHVEAVLDAYLVLRDDLDPSVAAQVVLALCYHDAVYDARAKDNEARSAALARASLLPLGVAEPDLMEIERLILATRDHLPTDAASALVVDADLAILQSPPEDYDRYAAAIREEYAFVPDDDYRAGRTRVLQGLLGRRLFASPLLDEDAAQANLLREIESLARPH